MLKLLYERPFRHWLDADGGLKNSKFNEYIKSSIEDATTRARKQNEKNSDHPDVTIFAKALRIIQYRTFASIHDFFDHLAAETASEMRVQKGYESNPERAKKQAEFIEKLKCDVLARAFNDWLEAQELAWLVNAEAEIDVGADNPSFDWNKANKNQTRVDQLSQGDSWQHSFYILLYLMPASAASGLLHQLRKWQCVVKKGGETQNISQDNPHQDVIPKLVAALEIYLDMHDAVHTGGDSILQKADEIKTLFECEEDFYKVFPKSSDPSQPIDSHLPMRGLREMCCFGDLNALREIYAEKKITNQEIEDWLSKKRDISAKQLKREELHYDYSRGGKMDGSAYEEYKTLVENITEYRHLTEHVTLTNYVRLHGLLRDVLARLVDYTGLWERDLYFITLAKMYRRDELPHGIFTSDGLEFLANGQIVYALRNLTADQNIFEDNNFPNGQSKKCAEKWRNNFAHFNMLQSSNVQIDLTSEINTARQLMAYDRKLKNAVTTSIRDLLQREKIDIEWKMTNDHCLERPEIKSRRIRHLDIKDIMKKRKYIVEELQGEAYTKMVAKLFNGVVGKTTSYHESGQPPKGGKNHHGTPKKGKRRYRK